MGWVRAVLRELKTEDSLVSGARQMNEHCRLTICLRAFNKIITTGAPSPNSRARCAFDSGRWLRALSIMAGQSCAPEVVVLNIPKLTTRRTWKKRRTEEKQKRGEEEEVRSTPSQSSRAFSMFPLFSKWGDSPTRDLLWPAPVSRMFSGCKGTSPKRGGVRVDVWSE